MWMSRRQRKRLRRGGALWRGQQRHQKMNSPTLSRLLRGEIKGYKKKPVEFCNKEIVKVRRFGFKCETETGSDKSFKNFHPER